MTKLAFSVAAMLLASSSAFAGSHHHRPRAVHQAAATVDSTRTAAVRKPDMVRQGMQAPVKSAADEPDHSLWGN